MGEAAVDLREDIERTRTQMSGTLEAIGDRVSPARQIERRWNRVRLSGRRARNRVMGSADDMRGWLTEKAHDATDMPGDAVDGLKTRTQGSPLTAGAVALGLGALAGAVIPASRKEKELLGEPAQRLIEPLKETVAEVTQDVREDLRQPVQEAVQEVKETARSGVDEVKQTAQDGAQEVKQQATS